jgi:hypothetical protein
LRHIDHGLPSSAKAASSDTAKGRLEQFYCRGSLGWHPACTRLPFAVS